MSSKMHADEVDTDPDLMRRLLAGQFPQWADLAIMPVPSAGTENALYRLGEDMVMRLPRVLGSTEQVEKEQRWLPQFAPVLPLTIPAPLAMGEPAEGYPWKWSIYRWLEGETATHAELADPIQAATTIAEFITALRQIDASDGPGPGSHNYHRGVPLSVRDAGTRRAIAELASMGNMIDTDAAIAAWEFALRAPEWDGPPVWIHGDLQAGNLLLQQGQISAVIDFGCLGVGDPACDLQIAWNYFTGDARSVFRAALSVDDASWARGRGWALSAGMIALPYYHVTNPILAGIARQAIAEVLADHRHSA